MRKCGKHLNRFRERHPTLGRSSSGTMCGYFEVPFHGVLLRVISSGESCGDQAAEIWEHVSVSLPGRCPTWPEMCHIKDLFWTQQETAIQFHPHASEYVNFHPFCLHLWRNPVTDHPLPPTICVGPTKFGIEKLIKE
jgi:hypothetical protein